MPELPEVETVRRSLARLIVGQTIATVEVREPRLRRPLAADFVTTLTGRAICQVERRGNEVLMHRQRKGGGWAIMGKLAQEGTHAAVAHAAAAEVGGDKRREQLVLA